MFLRLARVAHQADAGRGGFLNVLRDDFPACRDAFRFKNCCCADNDNVKRNFFSMETFAFAATLYSVSRYKPVRARDPMEAKRSLDAKFVDALSRHRLSMYRVALSILKSPADAEDAVSDATLNSYRVIRRIRDWDAIKPFLMRVTINACYGILRKRKREVMRPKAQDSQSQYWTEAEVAEILRIAGENGLSLSEEIQARLLKVGGYPKEELMRLFMKLDLGYYPSTWSIEDQVWYGRMLVDTGLIDETFNTLPEEGEATESEVLAVLQAHILRRYDPGAPLTDETIYRRHATYAWMQVNPDDESVLEKRWFVEYEPLDLTHSDYSFLVDTKANILEERSTPGLMSQDELPTPRALMERYEELYGKFNGWEMATWVGFQQMLRDAAANHGFGSSKVLELLSRSEFAIPQEGEMAKNAAVDAAMGAVMAQESIQESDLQRSKAYGVYLRGGEAPIWKVTIPAAREGNYIAEVNAQNGEVRNILPVPLHGSGSIARSFMLESVYQAHHAEAEFRAGTLRFDGRLAGAKPLRSGDFLLYGLAWVDADTTDAWAARVNPAGETLWEVRLEEGMCFDAAVALSDGGILLAMLPKKGEPFTLTVVTLDADGQRIGDPVTLQMQGWAYEGKDCLLVHKHYPADSSRRTPPYTLLAVDGKGETLWEHTYDELKGTGGFPWPAANGYVYSGMTQDAPFDQTGGFAMMTRLDDQGNLLWKRRMGQFPGSSIMVHLETNDGGMFGTGMFMDVIRFDAEGNVLWCSFYPQQLLNLHDAYSIQALLPAPDDGVLAIAQKRRTGNLMFIHLEKDGNVVAAWWQKLEDFPTSFREAFTTGEQIYLVYQDEVDYGPSNNTYIAPFIWPKDDSLLETVELVVPEDMPSNG